MYDVDGKKLNSIKSMHVNTLVCAGVKPGESKCFIIGSAVRQGCIIIGSAVRVSVSLSAVL